MIEIEVQTNSLEELVNTLHVFHEYLHTFTKKHPEVSYSMKASRINPEDNTKHILKVTVEK